jgi:signal transduction histidine kinase
LADLPIRVKFMLVSVAITLAGLTVAISFFLVHEEQQVREDLTRRTQVLASVVGNNTTAALAFRDQDTANEILGAMKEAPGVLCAALYDANRRLFATYLTRSACPIPAWPDLSPDTHAFHGDTVCLSKTVRLDNDTIGYLFICASTASLKQARVRGVTLAALVLLVSLLAAMALSWHLQRRVAEPILQLARTAGEITRSQEYAHCMQPAGKDEIGVLVSSFNTMIERIRTREDALRANARLLEDYQERLRSMAAELVVAEERERRVLAEALHDSVCQTLTVAKLQLDCLLKRERADENEVARLTHSRNLVEQAVVEARGLIGQMSPPVLYDVGLDAAIDHLADQIEDRFGLKIRVQTDDGDGEGIPLSDDLRVLLYRAVQELLMNVVKHAGATQAEVKLRQRDGQAEVSVSDNGSGFQRPSAETVPTAHGGFGLFSLRERVRHTGGELTVDSKPGEGACVRIAVPLRGPESPRRAAPA